MSVFKTLAAVGVATAPVGCESSTGPAPSIQLTQSHAALLVSRISDVALLHSDIAWLADSVNLGGYRQAPGAPPPESVGGGFGSPNPSLSVTGHLFHIQGNTITEWRAATGSATLQNGTTTGDCVGVQPVTGVTCEQSSLISSFTIDVARHDAGSPSDTRAASLASSEVAGIRLNFQ